jgi:molybdopterin/thiamine biosynthesis adenylyltransferase
VTSPQAHAGPALPLPWWEQWQGRIEWEVDCFERRGLPVSILEDPREGADRLILQSFASLHDGSTTLVKVVYPSSYPHRPFTVYTPDLSLPRHQSPGGNVCVFPRGDKHWHPHLAAADAVADDVPRLVRLVAAGGDLLRNSEDSQGEPVSAYYGTTVQGGIVLTDRAFGFAPETGAFGELDVAFHSDQKAWMLGIVDGPDAPIAAGQGLLVELRGRGGPPTVGSPRPALRSRYGNDILTGRWLYLDEAPLVESASDMWAVCASSNRELARWVHATVGLQLVGVCFPEEVRQGVYGLGWAFLCRQVFEERVKAKGARGGRSGNPGGAQVVRNESEWQFVRALRWTDDNLSVRIPELAPLRDKSVFIVGLGSLGAPVALELAKERIKAVRLLDGDFLDPGTSVRHPIGLDHAGLAKVAAVAEAIHAHNPDVSVEGSLLRIGHGSLETGDVTEHQVVTDLLRGSDLLISATAEHDVNRYLDSVASQLNVPRLYLWSQSGYGGVVAALRIGQTACYHCLNEYLSDLATAGTPAVEVPEGWEERGTVQGPGCGDQTFTAAHADLLPISIQAARVANGVLCASEGGYPAMTGDVFTVQTRELDGSPIPPRWTTHTLPPTDECPTCHPG